jgi:O-antigen/teichoic acid export membrane protein
MINSESSKRIAKNTSMLYIRMLLTMAVSLYTSRVVLDTLGVVDFGVYNVVGGIVMMFSFINSAMSSATQRFLSFELGKGDNIQFNRVFSMSVNIHLLIAGIVFILAETLGLWFLNAKLVIPADRMVASNWVYQFSIFAIILSIVSVPYNAVIVAYERMNVYAYISVIEVVLRLMIVFALVWIGFDKLKLYAVLVFCVTTFIFFIYRFYHKQNFPDLNYQFYWDKSQYKTLINYAAWNLFGNIASVTMSQGINIMLNLHFGPAVNAARAIAFQVNSAVGSFVTNFQLALNPQIIKAYAAEDLNYMHKLIFQGAKFSFFLFFTISMPIILETEYILKLWLKLVPEYTVIFTQLVIVNVLLDTLSGPLMTAAQATGKIRLYQAVVGFLLLLILPVSWIFICFGFEPQITLYVSITISLIAFFARLKIISPLVKMPISNYVTNVVFRILMVVTLSTVLPLIIKTTLPQGLGRLMIISSFSLISVIFTIFTVGLTKGERVFVQNRSRQLFAKTRN